MLVWLSWQSSGLLIRGSWVQVPYRQPEPCSGEVQAGWTPIGPATPGGKSCTFSEPMIPGGLDAVQEDLVNYMAITAPAWCGRMLY